MDKPGTKGESDDYNHTTTITASIAELQCIIIEQNKIYVNVHVRSVRYSEYTHQYQRLLTVHSGRMVLQYHLDLIKTTLKR